ncbi:hypothetical protein, partial [Catenibacterium sp.]|uniref:hypothetical protein n=1 Tax=Catenibacterium sp. TaxID=2049022 RepID=UPI003FD7FF7D
FSIKSNLSSYFQFLLAIRVYFLLYAIFNPCILHNLKLIILSPNTTICCVVAYLATTGNKKSIPLCGMLYWYL